MTLLASNQPRLASPPRGADERRRVSSLLFASPSLERLVNKNFPFPRVSFSFHRKGGRGEGGGELVYISDIIISCITRSSREIEFYRFSNSGIRDERACLPISTGSRVVIIDLSWSRSGVCYIWIVNIRVQRSRFNFKPPQSRRITENREKSSGESKRNRQRGYCCNWPRNNAI